MPQSWHGGRGRENSLDRPRRHLCDNVPSPPSSRWPFPGFAVHRGFPAVVAAAAAALSLTRKSQSRLRGRRRRGAGGKPPMCTAATPVRRRVIVCAAAAACLPAADLPSVYARTIAHAAARTHETGRARRAACTGPRRFRPLYLLLGTRAAAVLISRGGLRRRRNRPPPRGTLMTFCTRTANHCAVRAFAGNRRSHAPSSPTRRRYRDRRTFRMNRAAGFIRPDLDRFVFSLRFATKTGTGASTRGADAHGLTRFPPPRSTRRVIRRGATCRGIRYRPFRSNEKKNKIVVRSNLPRYR